MNITKDSVASFHYTLKDDDGNTIDTSEGQEPLPYLHGAGNIVPGLERELEGKVIGDKLSVIVKPVDGYGELNETLMQELPKSMFAGVDDIQAGMDFHAGLLLSFLHNPGSHAVFPLAGRPCMA